MHLSVTKGFYHLCNLLKKVNSLPLPWDWGAEICWVVSVTWGAASGWALRFPWPCIHRQNYLWVPTGAGEMQQGSSSLIWSVHHVILKSFDFMLMILCNHLVKQNKWFLDRNTGVHPGHQNPYLSALLLKGLVEECSLKHAFRCLSAGLKQLRPHVGLILFGQLAGGDAC